MKIHSELYERLDARITDWMARCGILILRMSVGIIFFWFGFLKYFPGLSVEQDLAVRTVGLVSFGLVQPAVGVKMAATCESLIGAGLVSGRFMRVTLLLLFLHLLCTLIPLGVFHQEMFAVFPLVPTLEGQYIIKNLILIGAGLVLGATVRGGVVIADPALAGREQERLSKN